MFSVEDVCTELSQLVALLQCRTGDVAVRLRDSTVSSMTSAILQLPVFTTSSALNIQHAIGHGYSLDVVKSAIEAAIDARLAIAVEPTGATRVGKADAIKPQLIPRVTNYLTANDWVQLKDFRVAQHQKFIVFYFRFNRLGIHSMDEQLAKQCIAIVLYVSLMSNAEIGRASC